MEIEAQKRHVMDRHNRAVRGKQRHDVERAEEHIRALPRDGEGSYGLLPDDPGERLCGWQMARAERNARRCGQQTPGHARWCVYRPAHIRPRHRPQMAEELVDVATNAGLTIAGHRTQQVGIDCYVHERRL